MTIHSLFFLFLPFCAILCLDSTFLFFPLVPIQDPQQSRFLDDSRRYYKPQGHWVTVMGDKPGMKKRPEPIDERGSLKEASLIPQNNKSRDYVPPPRLDSLKFPLDRLPKLEVDIVKRLPGVGDPLRPEEHDPLVNHNVDPSLPMAVEPEKMMFNLWENTQTQTEVRWKPPENKDKFSSILYQLELKKGDGEWIELAENRLALYRIYYVDGVAIFGRQRISQDIGVLMVRLRIRAVGEINLSGKVERKIGPWSNEILFSLEGSGEIIEKN